MKNIYDEYKSKLVTGINQVMGENYVSAENSIDDLETTFSDQVGEEKLQDVQAYYGLDE